MIGHAIMRFLEHYCAAPSIVIMLTFVMAWVGRRWHPTWLPKRPLYMMILAAIVIVPLAFLREPYDVGVVKDPVWKSYTDLLSWILGAAVTPWAVYRLHKWFSEQE